MGIFSLLAILLVVAAVPASAETGGYPDWAMPCEHSPYSAAGPCSNYDWGPVRDGAESTTYSSRSYGYRNCTDYVAWKLAQGGYGMPRGIGHANAWDEYYRGKAPINGTPAIGAIAQSNAGSFGHVAYVESISGSNVTVSEYNWYALGNYDTRTVAASSFNYIHVHDQPGSTGGTPIGSVDQVSGWGSGNAFVRGWAMDPDAKTTSTSVHVYIDGPAGAGTFFGAHSANQSRPDVAAAYAGSNDAHGFAFALSGIATGHHTLYIYAIDIAGGGTNPLLASVGVDVPGSTAGSAFGSLDGVTGRVGHIAHLGGWAADPDAPTSPVHVHVYADGWPGGSGAGTDLGSAAVARNDVAAAYPGYGSAHGFESDLGGLTPGLHTLWVFAINVAGGGDNTFLAERDVVVPGPDPIGNIEQVTGGVPGMLQFRGWVLDPDTPTAVATAHVYVDGPAGQGTFGGAFNANWSRPDVAKQLPGAGSSHGLLFTIGGISPGTHDVYVYGISTNGGFNPQIGHVTVNVPVLAAGSPFGHVDAAVGKPGGVARLTGWGADPNAPTTPLHVHAYVDGWAGSGAPGTDLGVASRARSDVAAAHLGYGTAHGFDTSLTGLSPGRHMIWLYAINAAGAGDNPLLAVVTVTVGPGVPDKTAPTMSVSATPTFSLASAMTARYAGADISSGVWNYDVRYRRAGFNGAFGALTYPSSWQHRTGTSISLAVSKGWTVCVSARARDNAGNVSGWSAERCSAFALDERSLAASAGWTRTSSSAYYASTVSRAISTGRTLTRTSVQTRRISIVATTCSGCGTIGVYWNGKFIKQISLNASITHNRQVLIAATFGTVGSGTVVIKTLNTRRVYIDGIAVSRL
jgi:surface antigen